MIDTKVLVETQEKVENLLNSIKELSKKEFIEEFKKLTKEEKEEFIEWLKEITPEYYNSFYNTELKEYEWVVNTLFLEIFSKWGMHWTFIQWKNKWYKVKKWSEGIPLIQPIKKFIKEEEGEEEENKKEKVVWFKIFYVFHEDQVENI